MTSRQFVPDPGTLPKPADAERARTGLERWREATRDSETAGFAEAFAEAPGGRALLEAVFGNSPYLTSCLLREAAFMQAVVETGCDAALDAVLRAFDKAGEETDEKAAMQMLRRAKRQAALLIAIADMSAAWPLRRVMEALSDAADHALDACVRFTLGRLVAEGRIAPPAPARPWNGCGYVVLGMGKLGSRELNYSSDIDLIVLYEPQRLQPSDPDRLRADMVRATQTLVRLMDERTADGYVFRTDLRLRPDPGMTPIAITVSAAEGYYESVGQNWERAAMIKARPAAGDIDLGERFLRHIRPFVWRKHLDFAAIADIQSIKRQINAHRGGGAITAEGHNIKVGRGGIREIEFYAQTLQLIWGGRQPDVRARRTGDALAALARHEHVDPDTRDRLIECYGFLRTLEHRLQMTNDEQTQKLPGEAKALDALGVFMGYGEPAAFRADLLNALHTVDDRYARLFADSPDLGGGRSLVFTGAADDPDTLETLAEMGFVDPEHVAGRVKVWHHGRYRATRSERARQILTELMPRLLKALARTANPDQAFARFDSFLGGLPAGVQVFSLFYVNPPLLDLVAEIMGSAPRLAEVLSRRPILLDAVLSDAADDIAPDASGLQTSLEEALGEAGDFQDVLDIIRRWAADRRFLIGVHILRGRLTGEAAGPLLTAVADAAIDALVPRVMEEFTGAHGGFAAGGVAILGLGKLGGRELTPISDLDLVFLYDAPQDAEQSDGAKPLGPMVYYTRLAQRIVTAITAQMPEGSLYEVDTRLRPHGSKGPLGMRLEGFEAYYDGEAWTWEEMALTRARVVCAPEALRARIEEAIRRALRRDRDPDALVVAVSDMRRRIAKEHSPDRPWVIKYRRGGMIDVEFIAQYLMLRHAAAHPKILRRNTGEALEKLAEAEVLDGRDARTLLDALRLWRNLQAVLRLTAGDSFDEANAPDGQKRALAEAAGTGDFAELGPLMERTAEAVGAVFARLIDEPAAALREAAGEDSQLAG